MNSTVAPQVFPSHNASKAHSNVNASGYYVEEELGDTGLSEVQTQMVAGVMTVIPLAFIVVALFGIRFLIKKFLRRNRDLYNGGLHRNEGSEPNKSSHLLLPDEMKTSESQFSVIPAEELDEVMTSYGTAVPSNHTSKSTANGSIITLTMKNNHLIVETEERISGVAETPARNEVVPNVYVVELQDDKTASISARELDDQTALVHQSEDDLSDDDYLEGPNTGLSQSDLSASSAGSTNPSYRYGNQAEYTFEGRIRDLQKASKGSKLPMCQMVQQSQDIVDEDELYLEQQRQLGHGVEERFQERTVPDIMYSECIANQFVNPAFVPTPESQVNPIS